MTAPVAAGVNPVPAQMLRGIVARLIRGRNGAGVTSFDVNPELRRLFPGQYRNVLPPEVTAIEAGLRTGPFPKTGTVEFSLEYWYNYFFKELPAPRKLGFAVEVVNDDGTFRNEATPPAKSWKTLFAEMLALGFKAFTTADHITAEQALNHAASIGPNVENSVLQRQGVKVLFRGDGRLPEMIRAQGGTARQSRVDSLRASRNITKDWHPFNEQGHKVWVRSGYNGDNCLFSAVSVTPQFGIATKFPLLDDLRGSSPASIGHSIVMVRVPRANAAAPTNRPAPRVAAQYQAAVQNSSDIEARTLLASRTNIYCVRLRDVYNTQNYQVGEAFAEYATTRISWMDHLMWFAVTRIHFDEFDGNLGHQIVVTDFKLLQDTSLMENVLVSPTGVNHLRTFANDVVRRGSVASGGYPYLPMGGPPPLDIVAIRDLFIPGRPSGGMRGPAPVGPLPGRPQATVGRIQIPTAFNQTS